MAKLVHQKMMCHELHPCDLPDIHDMGQHKQFIPNKQEGTLQEQQAADE